MRKFRGKRKHRSKANAQAHGSGGGASKMASDTDQHSQASGSSVDPSLDPSVKVDLDLKTDGNVKGNEPESIHAIKNSHIDASSSSSSSSSSPSSSSKSSKHSGRKRNEKHKEDNTCVEEIKEKKGEEVVGNGGKKENNNCKILNAEESKDPRVDDKEDGKDDDNCEEVTDTQRNDKTKSSDEDKRLVEDSVSKNLNECVGNGVDEYIDENDNNKDTDVTVSKFDVRCDVEDDVGCENDINLDKDKMSFVLIGSPADAESSDNDLHTIKDENVVNENTGHDDLVIEEDSKLERKDGTLEKNASPDHVGDDVILDHNVNVRDSNADSVEDDCDLKIVESDDGDEKLNLVDADDCKDEHKKEKEDDKVVSEDNESSGPADKTLSHIQDGMASNQDKRTTDLQGEHEGDKVTEDRPDNSDDNGDNDVNLAENVITPRHGVSQNENIATQDAPNNLPGSENIAAGHENTIEERSSLDNDTHAVLDNQRETETASAANTINISVAELGKGPDSVNNVGLLHEDIESGKIENSRGISGVSDNNNDEGNENGVTKHGNGDDGGSGGGGGGECSSNIKTCNADLNNGDVAKTTLHELQNRAEEINADQNEQRSSCVILEHSRHEGNDSEKVSGVVENENETRQCLDKEESSAAAPIIDTEIVVEAESKPENALDNVVNQRVSDHVSENTNDMPDLFVSESKSQIPGEDDSGVAADVSDNYKSQNESDKREFSNSSDNCKDQENEPVADNVKLGNRLSDATSFQKRDGDQLITTPMVPDALEPTETTPITSSPSTATTAADAMSYESLQQKQTIELQEEREQQQQQIQLLQQQLQQQNEAMTKLQDHAQAQQVQQAQANLQTTSLRTKLRKKDMELKALKTHQENHISVVISHLLYLEGQMQKEHKVITEALNEKEDVIRRQRAAIEDLSMKNSRLLQALKESHGYIATENGISRSGKPQVVMQNGNVSIQDHGNKVVLRGSKEKGEKDKDKRSGTGQKVRFSGMKERLRRHKSSLELYQSEPLEPVVEGKLRCFGSEENLLDNDRPSLYIRRRIGSDSDDRKQRYGSLVDFPDDLREVDESVHDSPDSCFGEESTSLENISGSEPYIYQASLSNGDGRTKNTQPSDSYGFNELSKSKSVPQSLPTVTENDGTVNIRNSSSNKTSGSVKERPHSLHSVENLSMESPKVNMYPNVIPVTTSSSESNPFKSFKNVFKRRGSKKKRSVSLGQTVNKDYQDAMKQHFKKYDLT